MDYRGTYIIQARTLVILQQTVLAAEVALAETAVAHDALRFDSALGHGAADLFEWHCCVVPSV